MSSPLHVFLVEDNAADAFLVNEALRCANLDFKLRRAADGETAIRALREIERDGPPADVILLDLNLPRVSGHELLAHIRRSEFLRNTPVIVLTSSDSPDDRRRVAALGVSHYFRKPSEYTDFLELGNIIGRVCDAGARA
jgi:CheY-like chemotaxis protein